MEHPGVDWDQREGASAKDGGAWLRAAVFGGVTAVVWMWLGEYLGLDGLSDAVQIVIAGAVGMVVGLYSRERKSRIVDAGQDPPMTVDDVRKQHDESRGLIDRIRRALRLSDAGDD